MVLATEYTIIPVHTTNYRNESVTAYKIKIKVLDKWYVSEYPYDTLAEALELRDKLKEADGY